MEYAVKPPCQISSPCVCPVPENVGGISSVLMTTGRRVRAGLSLPGLQDSRPPSRGRVLRVGRTGEATGKTRANSPVAGR